MGNQLDPETLPKELRDFAKSLTPNELAWLNNPVNAGVLVNYLQQLMIFPTNVIPPRLQDFWRIDHRSHEDLARYAHPLLKRQMPAELGQDINNHVTRCSLCLCLLQFYMNLVPELPEATRFKASSSDPQRYIHIDDIEKFGSSVTSMMPGMGIASGFPLPDDSPK